MVHHGHHARRPVHLPRLWGHMDTRRRSTQGATGHLDRGDVRMTRATHCLGCNKRMRPKHTLAKDYPGTVAHKGKNYCTGCYPKQAARRAEQRTPALDKTVMQRLDTLHQGINPIRERRNRGIPARGQRMKKRRPARHEASVSNCCGQCKTPYFCGNRNCICHVAQADISHRTALPYADPTGNTAVRTEPRTQPKRNRQNR